MSAQTDSSLRWVRTGMSHVAVFQWMLEHTRLGETHFGLRHTSHLRRSTFRPPLTRRARRFERRTVDRLSS